MHLDEDLTFTVTVFLVEKENHLILKFLPYCPNLTAMNLYNRYEDRFSLTSCILDVAISL